MIPQKFTHRGEMMASIQKVGDKYRAQVAKMGVRKSAMWDTRREAVRWAERVEREIEDGLKGDKTLSQAVAKYTQTVSPTKRNPKWEEHRFDAFMEQLGADTPLADITTGVIGRWRDERLKTVVGATVQRESNLLRNLFTVARDEWQWITHNPFKGVRMPAQSDSRHQVWRWQDMKKVLRADRSGKTAEVIVAFRIALHTALRLSEILSGTYDARRRVIVLDRTKTSGRIEVPVTRRAAKLLPASFTVGANEASTLFSKLTRQLLIEDLTFHDTRATALTLLARRMDVMTLSRISRHRDIRILSNVYYRETAEQISARI
jgi:integrase